jgi:pimeloyl-ACP methyl ester carboxylesterase
MILSPKARAALRVAALLAAAPLFAQVLHASPACAAAPGAFQPTRFSVEVRGHGPDVILLPGLASSRAVWDATAKQLEANHRLHLVQFAGFGGQPAAGNAQGPVLAPSVEELHRYIAASGLKAPTVIGHSLGGLAGLMLAEAHPGDVGRLMIVDSFPFFSAAFNPTVTAEQAQTRAVALRDGLMAQTPEAFAASERAAMNRLALTPGARALALDWALASDRSVMARATYDDLVTDARPGLAALKMPVTVVFPYDASMGAPAEAVTGIYAGAYAALPGANLRRVDGAYHFLMLDQPEAFAREVARFAP